MAMVRSVWGRTRTSRSRADGSSPVASLTAVRSCGERGLRHLLPGRRRQREGLEEGNGRGEVGGIEDPRRGGDRPLGTDERRRSTRGARPGRSPAAVGRGGLAEAEVDHDRRRRRRTRTFAARRARWARPASCRSCTSRQTASSSSSSARPRRSASRRRPSTRSMARTTEPSGSGVIAATRRAAGRRPAGPAS